MFNGRAVVNEQLLNDPLCMNLQLGGGGGFCNEKHKKDFQKAGWIAAAKSGKNQKKLRKLKKDKNSEWYKKFSKNLSSSKIGNQIWLGKKHKPKTIEKMRKSKNVGKNNSQFGTIWITKGKESKKIKKEHLDEWILLKWKRGRK